MRCFRRLHRRSARFRVQLGESRPAVLSSQGVLFGCGSHSRRNMRVGTASEQNAGHPAPERLPGRNPASRTAQAALRGHAVWWGLETKLHVDGPLPARSRRSEVSISGGGSSVSSQFSRAIQKAIHSEVVARGYRREGALSARKLEGLWHLIGVQTSDSGTADSGKCTVNLAVWCEELGEGSPSIWGAHWRQRIGNLMPNPSDRWWDVSDASVGEVSKTVAATVVQYGLPALDAIDSVDALRALWESGRSPGLTEQQRRRNLAALGAAMK